MCSSILHLANDSYFLFLLLLHSLELACGLTRASSTAPSCFLFFQVLQIQVSLSPPYLCNFFFDLRGLPYRMPSQYFPLFFFVLAADLFVLLVIKMWESVFRGREFSFLCFYPSPTYPIRPPFPANVNRTPFLNWRAFHPFFPETFSGLALPIDCPFLSIQGSSSS